VVRRRLAPATWGPMFEGFNILTWGLCLFFPQLCLWSEEVPNRKSGLGTEGKQLRDKGVGGHRQVFFQLKTKQRGIFGGVTVHEK